MAAITSRDRVETIETVAALLDVAIVIRQTGNTAMVECTMCGQRDEHHLEGCPVPALEQWLFDSAKDPQELLAVEQAWNELGPVPKPGQRIGRQRKARSQEGANVPRI